MTLKSIVKSILLIFLFSSKLQGQDYDKITTIPATPKAEFSKFLSGVNHVLLLHDKPKSNEKEYIFGLAALIEFLREMGFQSIQYYSGDYVVPDNTCEIVFVGIEYDYDENNYYNVKLIFESFCLNYTWEFKSSQSIPIGNNYNGKNNFYHTLKKICPYKKPSFSPFFTLKFSSQKTSWNEFLLKEEIKNKGCDRIEGIYENSSSATSDRYKIAVRKIGETYYFIYLSGGNKNANIWKEGDIKAVLEPTATASFYKAKWYMANKSLNDEHYVSFDQGFLTVLEGTNKELYIKLFPSASDKINSPGNKSSGSGFAITSNGYIVTNYHVTQGSSNIKVRGINGDFSISYSAKVISEDKNNDLSIIKIEDPYFTSCGTIPYTINSRASEVGTSIFVLGYPLRATMGDEIKLTNGIISSKSGFQGDITSYQVTAPIQPGNSGGPMFDRNGNLVGIINAKHGGAENASYAIKSSYLLTLIDLLQTTPSMQTTNLLRGKTLTEQVKSLKRFTYIIEVN